MIGRPGWLSGKESAHSAEATEDLGSIPGSGRFPGEGRGNPLQYSSLENPVDRGSWQRQFMGPQRAGHDYSESART